MRLTLIPQYEYINISSIVKQIVKDEPMRGAFELITLPEGLFALVLIN